ncbi:LuxR C-terminal-related transcriptional regulator [Solitalea sp. MAHUQ-68]|uniref:LuxR C-terminal-related transcriptional regulator n=1 Tax=Solitalea agri TaxID=2953739 RepID=A0A9X2F348_9SPHI|nr:LuxR C-terminal-related transcriptional regulator [Solitalea agri]MCO4293772.1 LuxR C-terminal-related transcriptional regulator [Solitalea agri]
MTQNNEIDELKKRIEELEKRLEFLNAVVHKLPANIYVSNLNEKKIVWCNHKHEVSTGYTLKEASEMGFEFFQQTIHPDDLNIPEDSIQHYSSPIENDFGGIFRTRRKDSTDWKWYAGWATTFVEKEEKPVEILCVDVELSGSMHTIAQSAEALKEVLTFRNKYLIEKLTGRELEILKHVGNGLSNKMIAEELNISLLTVQTHRRNIREKLSTSNTAELVALAKESGIS